MAFWIQRAELAAPPADGWWIWGKVCDVFLLGGRLIWSINKHVKADWSVLGLFLWCWDINILLLITNIFIIRGEREGKEKWKLVWLTQSKQPYPALYIYFMFIPSHYFPVINLVFVSNFKWVICCFVLGALGRDSCLSMAYSLYLRRDFLIKAVKCLRGLEQTNKKGTGEQLKG